MSRMLPKSFFNRKTLVVARDLIGKTLARRIGARIIREKITEVEAYVGSHDLASHAARGKTERTKVMYLEAGRIYVYFVYGMYYMLNIVTEEKDSPAAVLIRGTENYRGPGVLTRELKIDKELNGAVLSRKSGLWIEDGEQVSNKRIKKTPRIGINYAGEVWSKKLYRFILR